MLRLVCGFSLAEQGADIRLIQDKMGHRNIQHNYGDTVANLAQLDQLWDQLWRTAVVLTRQMMVPLIMLKLKFILQDSNGLCP